jgi:hypothetical protein
MKTITDQQKKAIIYHLEKAQDVCAKHGLALGNGGDIASMLGGISSEIANGEAKQIEELVE